MPFGRNPSEKRWFKGWYEVVIKPGVIEADYLPVLAAQEEQPGAINDEIRSHLAFDPMVVVDLGGADPADLPNPNVMYELGIRHALGLPVVIMAWEGQNLPFDVANQRVIMEERDFLAQEITRKKLVSFIKAAEEGRYYRPMEAVGRIATIEAASANLGEDAIMAALAQEVKQLRGTVAAALHPQNARPVRAPRHTLKSIFGSRTIRKELYSHFVASGGTDNTWGKLVRVEVTEAFIRQVGNWSLDDWKSYMEAKAKELGVPQKARVSSEPTAPVTAQLTDELLEAILQELPKQPWPKGVHKTVCEKLGISRALFKSAVNTLIQRGVLKVQIHGVLFEPGAIPPYQD